jgi:hypothetical protein
MSDNLKKSLKELEEQVLKYYQNEESNIIVPIYGWFYNSQKK